MGGNTATRGLKGGGTTALESWIAGVGGLSRGAEAHVRGQGRHATVQILVPRGVLLVVVERDDVLVSRDVRRGHELVVEEHGSQSGVREALVLADHVVRLLLEEETVDVIQLGVQLLVLARPKRRHEASSSTWAPRASSTPRPGKSPTASGGCARRQSRSGPSAASRRWGRTCS